MRRSKRTQHRTKRTFAGQKGQNEAIQNKRAERAPFWLCVFLGARVESRVLLVLFQEYRLQLQVLCRVIFRAPKTLKNTLFLELISCLFAVVDKTFQWGVAAFVAKSVSKQISTELHFSSDTFVHQDPMICH